MQTRALLVALVSASISVLGAAAAAAKTIPGRPKITGISHLAVYTSDAPAAEHFYTMTVGAQKQADPENPKGARYMLNAVQYVEVLPLPDGQGVNRLDHVAFNTDSADGMRKYLAARGWKTPASVERGKDGSRWFEVF